MVIVTLCLCVDVFEGSFRSAGYTDSQFGLVRHSKLLMC